MDESIGIVLMQVFQAGDWLIYEELNTFVVHFVGFKILLVSSALPSHLHKLICSTANTLF